MWLPRAARSPNTARFPAVPAGRRGAEGPSPERGGERLPAIARRAAFQTGQPGGCYGSNWPMASRGRGAFKARRPRLQVAAACSQERGGACAELAGQVPGRGGRRGAGASDSGKPRVGQRGCGTCAGLSEGSGLLPAPGVPPRAPSRAGYTVTGRCLERG